MVMSTSVNAAKWKIIRPENEQRTKRSIMPTFDEWIPHMVISAILDLIEERMNEISHERPAKRTRHEAEENPAGEHVSAVLRRCEHRCNFGQSRGFAGA
jgi:hypothetical protein